MKLNNNVYDVLKWIALICLPAVGVAYQAIASVWSLPYAAEVAQTVNAVAVLIGALIGISTAEYNKEQK